LDPKISTKENRRTAEEELLAENLRLCYVALTRARNRCYFVWGRFNQADTSAPAYLLHPPPDQAAEGADILEAASERFKGMHDEELLTELTSFQRRSEGAIALSDMPRDHQGHYLPPSAAEERDHSRAGGSRHDG